MSRPEHLRRHLLTHVEEKPFRCSACDFTSRRVDRIRKHQRKAHPADAGDATLTVLSLDVKLPDGVIINGQTGEVKYESMASTPAAGGEDGEGAPPGATTTPSQGQQSSAPTPALAPPPPGYSDHAKVLSELHMSASKSSKSSKSARASLLPTMVPPNLPRLPPLSVPTFSSNPDTLTPGGNNGNNLPGEPPYGHVGVIEAGSGPVFPGQISPRVKDDGGSEAKRSKIEYSQDNHRQFQTPPPLHNNPPSKAQQPQSGSSSSSSRRKTQPTKREPDETLDDRGLLDGRRSSTDGSTGRSPLASFEGFGSSDFSSIAAGIQNNFAQHPSAAAAAGFGNPMRGSNSAGIPPVPPAHHHHVMPPGAGNPMRFPGNPHGFPPMPYGFLDPHTGLPLEMKSSALPSRSPSHHHHHHPPTTSTPSSSQSSNGFDNRQVPAITTFPPYSYR